MNAQTFPHILVTGGAGYVGCRLTQRLLERGHRVTVYDVMFFGDGGLPKHRRLDVVKGDIRDTEHLEGALSGVDAVIHLACLSNDPSYELDGGLGKSINFDCFEPMVLAAKHAGVRRFIYASTSSVYGVSDAPDIKEDHPLLPVTDYNKYKGMCEPILQKHENENFIAVTVRPATLCGYSPRQRLDLTVNLLTNHAVNKGLITVFGGRQMRANLHIDDMVDAYMVFLESPDNLIRGQTFNVGSQNFSVAEIAEVVRSEILAGGRNGHEIEIITTTSDDIRSYHVNSDKIRDVLGFVPKRTIADAVSDLCDAFRQNKLPDSLQDDTYYNVRQMKKLIERQGPVVQ